MINHRRQVLLQKDERSERLTWQEGPETSCSQGVAAATQNIRRGAVLHQSDAPEIAQALCCVVWVSRVAAEQEMALADRVKADLVSEAMLWLWLLLLLVVC